MNYQQVFINLFCAAIFSFSRNDKLVSKSSCESEVKALDAIVQEILYILELYMFLHMVIDAPIKIYIDNKAAIRLTQSKTATIARKFWISHSNGPMNYSTSMLSEGIHLFNPFLFGLKDVITSSGEI